MLFSLERCLTGFGSSLLSRDLTSLSLFASLGFGSLHEYVIFELKYSEGAAWRRINAMRALRDVPEAETQLKCGRLTISHLASAQSFCRKENKSKEEKKQILLSLEG